MNKTSENNQTKLLNLSPPALSVSDIKEETVELQNDIIEEVALENEFEPVVPDETDFIDTATHDIVEVKKVEISDDVVNDATVKELLLSQVEDMLFIQKMALREYYANTSYEYDEIKRAEVIIKGIGITRKRYTKDVFKFVYDDTIQMLRFMDKLTSQDIQSGRDIVSAIYGLPSDEMYIYRKFCKCYDEMYKWDETEMFQCSDERLKSILCI